MKKKGIVSGEAEAEYTWWFWYKKSPDTFANEIGGPLAIRLRPGVAEAAFYDACNKSFLSFNALLISRPYGT